MDPEKLTSPEGSPEAGTGTTETDDRTPTEVAHENVTHASQSGDMKQQFTELLDSIDAKEAAEKAAEAPTEADRPARQRDPKTGRFLKAEETKTPETRPNQEQRDFLPPTEHDKKNDKAESSSEMLQKARYYNFSEDDIKGMSPEQLDHSFRLIDMYEMKQRTPSGQKTDTTDTDTTGKPAQEQPTDPQQVMKQAQVPNSERTPDETSAEQPDILKGLQEAGYEDEVLEAFKAQSAQIKALTDKLQNVEGGIQQAQEAEARAWESRAINLIDEFDRSDLFGTPTGADDAQQRNMQAVLDELSELTGRGFPMDPFTTQRALNRVFGNQLVNQDQKAQTKAVQDQAAQVMGSGSTTKGRDTLDPPNDNPADDPLMRQFAEKTGMHL